MELYQIYKNALPIPSLPAEYLFNIRHCDYDNLGLSYLIETLITLNMYNIGMDFAQVYNICMFIENDHILYKNHVKDATTRLFQSLNDMMSAYAEIEKFTEYDTSQFKHNIQFFISQTYSRIHALNNSIL
jgi:hypothetical protein